MGTRSRFAGIAVAASMLLVVAVSLVAVAPLAGATTTTDGTFSNADWSALKVYDDTPGANGTFFVAQHSSGGNPEAYRRVNHDWTGPGGLIIAHWRSDPDAVHDPATDGAIQELDMSFDVFGFDIADTGAVGYRALVVQDGSYYLAGGGHAFSGGWTPISYNDLTESSFTKLGTLGTGGPTPDFSASGSPISFGYATANGTAGGTAHTESGIDNWNLSVTLAAGAGVIVFTRGVGTDSEIWIMNADGSSETRLTNNQDFDFQPAISPDGSKIAFVATRGAPPSGIPHGNGEIYVMDSDGTNVQRLTNTILHEHNPAFSPDGTQILFTSRRTGDDELWVMNADGSNQTQLIASGGIDDTPDWAPDGSRIAFYSQRFGNDRIMVMDANGANQIPIFSSGASHAPQWSADGTRIYFHNSDFFSDYEIWAISPDGSNPQRVTDNDGGDLNPTGSPDGSQIAFSSNTDAANLSHGQYDIYVTDADGSNRVRLTDHLAEDSDPDWGPGALSGDSDGDGVLDAVDNCPADANADQNDRDADTLGDVCDSDRDGDTVPNDEDAFPDDASETKDSDGDTVGDNADDFPNDPSETKDSDDDGVGDNADNCDNVANPGQADLDGDGIGDACDDDQDGDGLENLVDNCPDAANGDQGDQDNDGTGDVCDPDRDGDEVPNDEDAFPTDPDESQDSDNDGVGDNGDAFPFDPDETEDTDEDGVGDNTDNCASTANAGQADLDGDGVGDVCDDDRDGDGVDNGADNCPDAVNNDQGDLDADGTGDVCDGDRDGDEVPNGEDAFPDDGSESKDSDNDGVGDNGDAFPFDPDETKDTDEDGVGDNADNCDEVANPGQADLDGDGIGDACDDDRDGDGVDNGPDNCDEVSNADQADLDQDGIGDACDGDRDGDGVDNGTDNCPDAAHAGQGDLDGDGAGDACDQEQGPPLTKADCKNEGWKRFNNPSFKNQGACVSHVEKNKAA